MKWPPEGIRWPPDGIVSEWPTDPSAVEKIYKQLLEQMNGILLEQVDGTPGQAKPESEDFMEELGRV